MKRRFVWIDFNFKVVINDEFFGIINLVIREWKDGERGIFLGCFVFLEFFG